MVTTLQNPAVPAVVIGPAPEHTASAPAEHPVGPRTGVGLSIFAAVCVVVLALTTSLAVVLTDIPFLAAFGFGLYCAFWLGGGFGLIAASAFLFGRDH
ncbi:MAG: hypothetical protein AAGA65_16775 [Actinomycetota bacterium]